MKICVQGAAFDTPNMGVNALASGVIRTILHKYTETEIFILDYETFSVTYEIKSPERKISVPLVNMRFSWKFWLRNNIAFLLFLTALTKLLPSPALRRKWIGGNTCLRHLGESDLVVAISGGDSFSDVYGLERLLYVSLPQILALWAGKRLILLPQTLGPFRNRFTRAIARYILCRAELIYSRDNEGLRVAASLIGADHKSDNIRFCHDVGFVVDPTPPADLSLVGLPARRKEGSPLVGLNISGLLFMGESNHRNIFGLRVEYDSFVYRLVAFLIQRKGAAVLLIPHVFGSDRESDIPVCEKLYNALRPQYGESISLARQCYDVGQIKYVIGICDFFIGARMHACIAAASQNVPVVPTAYSDKFVGVMQTIGIEANVVDLRKMHEKEVFAVIDRAIDRRAEIRQQLARIMPKVKGSVLTLFEGIDSGALPAMDPAPVGNVPVAVMCHPHPFARSEMFIPGVKKTDDNSHS